MDLTDAIALLTAAGDLLEPYLPIIYAFVVVTLLGALGIGLRRATRG